MPSLAQIANSATFTAVMITGPDGRQRTSYVHRFQSLWCELFRTQTINVILIHNPGTDDGFDIALASTDQTASTVQIITGYDVRWTVETCHQKAKNNGVGDARNRVQNAVKRTIPFGLLCQTNVICGHQVHGNPENDLTTRRRNAPHDHPTTSPSKLRPSALTAT